MSDRLTPPPLPPQRVGHPLAPPLSQTLRGLYLKRFLRGRSARQGQDKPPKSIGARLGYALFFYGLIGFMTVVFLGQPVFALSLYIHSTTLMFLSLFVGASAGELLFSKDEPDILLHRPVPARTLLWAKISVLVQIALWLAGALNLVPFLVGLGASNGNWLYPLIHAVSIAMEALFCAGSVVLMYQLCLRWFGKERLDGIMTTAQVVLAMLTVIGSQLAPRLLSRSGWGVVVRQDAWWMPLLPPAWFAGFDDAFAGSGSQVSWMLAAIATAFTALVCFLAFIKLAGTYEQGLQTLNESPTKVKPRRARRWISTLVALPPLRWWLKDSVTRASFLLAGAYLARDRDVKLRVFPALTPVFIMPIVLWSQNGSVWSNGFAIAFGSVYLGMVPMEGLGLLRHSQQWQAADIFRAAPLPGPEPLCRGARRATLCFLTAPTVAIYLVLVLFLTRDPNVLILLLPGLLALPVFAMIPCLKGQAVPLSLPPEEAKAATRGIRVIGVMVLAVAIPNLALWAQSMGWLWAFLLIEGSLLGIAYCVMRRSSQSAVWPSME